MEAHAQLDAGLLGRIVGKIELGVGPKEAAMAEKVPKDVWEDWWQRGRQGEQPYDEMVRQVEQAEVTAEVALVVRIQAAAKEGSWGAAAWLAERRFPERYERKSIQGSDAPRNSGGRPEDDPFVSLDNVEALDPRRRKRQESA